MKGSVEILVLCPRYSTLQVLDGYILLLICKTIFYAFEVYIAFILDSKNQSF